MRHRLTTTALAHVWNFQRNELQQLNSPRAQASIGVFFSFSLCSFVFNVYANKRRDVFVSACCFWRYQCTDDSHEHGSYSVTKCTSHEIYLCMCLVFMACIFSATNSNHGRSCCWCGCCYTWISFFFVDFSMLVLVHSTKCSLYMLTKIPKIKKNLKAYFQSWILGETKTSVYTRAECKEPTEILVRVASTSNNKSNNIQPMKSETIAT